MDPVEVTRETIPDQIDGGASAGDVRGGAARETIIGTTD